jgi:heat shock protein HslJ
MAPPAISRRTRACATVTAIAGPGGASASPKRVMRELNFFGLFASSFSCRALKWHTGDHMKTVGFLVSALFFVAAAATPEGSDATVLEHTKWKLVEMNGRRPALPDEVAFTITLEGNSYLLSGCNLVSGRLRIEPQRLVFIGPTRSTKKACVGAAETADVAFSSLMSANPTYRIDQDRLILMSQSGTRWVMAKEPLASKNAKTKFIYVAAAKRDCVGMFPTKCLQIRESKAAPWTLLYWGIEGFEYVPGIEYRLRIKEDQVPRPVPDRASVVWYLDAVIEQSVVDRTAADEYLRSKTP